MATKMAASSCIRSERSGFRWTGAAKRRLRERYDAWDVEHTVAAIFADGRFIEFNGSVRGQ
jgi:hypothetical protein